MTPRLALSILLPLAACGLQWLLWEYIKPYAWFFFFPTAFFCAWLGGLRGGLAGTGISALLAWYFFIPSINSFTLETSANALSIVIFLIQGALSAYFFEQLHRSQRRSTTRFEATFEQAAVGIALLTPDGRWLRVNRKLSDIVGYPPDELLTKTFQDITHPDDLSADLELVQQVLAGEINTYTLEKRYLRKGGNIVWINLSVSLVRLPDGSPDYFISVIEDISARKITEANLTEAKRLAKLGHWYWDLRTDQHFWSDEIYRIYGRDPSLPPATYPDVQSYFTPESWAGLTAAVEAGMATGEAYQCDAEVVHPDGGGCWITARGECVRDVGGQIVALRGTVQDITERKLAESAIHEGEERYRELVESANSAIIRWSPDGTISYFNDFAQRLFGWQTEEALGQSIRILVPDTDSTGGDLKGLVSDIAANPERHQYSLNENICRDGRRVWMIWSNRAMRDAQGRITGILAVGNDMTEHKHTADELQQRNTELELFNAAAIGRELEMISLKKQINDLSVQLGRKPPFDLAFADESAFGAATR